MCTAQQHSNLMDGYSAVSRAPHETLSCAVPQHFQMCCCLLTQLSDLAEKTLITKMKKKLFAGFVAQHILNIDALGIMRRMNSV